jgi:hypothetical protein
MSGLGVERWLTGMGPHALPQNLCRFAAFALPRQKTGQVLVRNLGSGKASDFSYGTGVMSGDLNLGAADDQ